MKSKRNLGILISVLMAVLLFAWPASGQVAVDLTELRSTVTMSAGHNQKLAQQLNTHINAAETYIRQGNLDLAAKSLDAVKETVLGTPEHQLSQNQKASIVDVVEKVKGSMGSTGSRGSMGVMRQFGSKYRNCGCTVDCPKPTTPDAAGDIFCARTGGTTCGQQGDSEGCVCRLFVRKAGSTSDDDWKMKWQPGMSKVKPADPKEEEEQCFCSKSTE